LICNLLHSIFSLSEIEHILLDLLDNQVLNLNNLNLKDMQNNLINLKPDKLWFYFNEVCKIPRPSGKEEKISAYLMDFAEKHNLQAQKDKIGNILIKKNASNGMENSPIIILQSHIDMVCEKNADSTHNFLEDSIIPYINGEWVKAEGTTLGADDGIGIAAMLAVLEDDSLIHGHLECLFTVDEETGLTGAFGLEKDFLKGRILLNLDSEDEGQVFIGCAGGKDTVVTLKPVWVNPPIGFTPYIIKVDGLKGGHSGDDIHKGLGNANKILNRLIWESNELFEIKLGAFDGGNLRNAIAREANAVVLITDSDKYKFEKYVDTYCSMVKSELRLTEPDMKVSFEIIDMPDLIFDNETTHILINSLYACPHGVISWSREIEGFVQSSTNLASVKTTSDSIVITTSQRSSVESEKNDVVNMVSSVFRLSSANIEHSDGYPGWTPNPDSKVLTVVKKVYKNLFAVEPEVLVIHAGLECGLIGEKYPGMDMISFGPTIKGAHSPDERLHIESVTKFWELLLGILKECK